MKRQRGVALIIALLAVALALVLIAGLMDRGELTFARTQNTLRGEQAQAYAEGLEAFAGRVLVKSSEEGPGIDASDSLWALPLPPQTVPGGLISAQMRDRNGCFNLNNLAPGIGSRQAWLEIFQRLLIGLQLNVDIADAAADWTDPSPDSSGDGWYLGQPVPYRRAARIFNHVSELRLLRNVDSRTYARLAPYVCALPGDTRLNINTASVPVLMSLSDQITRALAERVWQGGRAHWMDVQPFLDVLQTAGIADAARLSGLVSTSSNYFEARGDIELDDIPFSFVSLIERSQGVTVRVLERSRGSDESRLAAAAEAASQP
ncbi:MAG: type II secretion system minor pseudopilin GspK [Dokdonella sp.]